MRLMVRQDPEHLKHDVNYFHLDLSAQVDSLVREFGEMNVEDMQALLVQCEEAVARINQRRQS